jgi:hypothetical protein
MLELTTFVIFWGTWSLACLLGSTFLVLVPKSKHSIVTTLVIFFSLAASIYTLGIALWVFAIAGSSHIRQLAGDSGYQMWEIWKNSPPSSRANPDWFWLRFSALLGAALSVCLTLSKLPNA